MLSQGAFVTESLLMRQIATCRSPTRKPDVLQPVHLTSPFGSLRSADDLLLPYTNYVRDYQGLLDYIFLEPGRMDVKRLLPIPPREELEGYIPSERFPSDHIAVHSSPSAPFEAFFCLQSA